MGNSCCSEAVEALERVARRSLGLFTISEARALGVSKEQLRNHTRPGGRFVRMFPRVYALARVAPTAQSRLLAALLWAGPEGVLSHRTAGAILRFDGVRPGPVELWHPSRTGPPAGITLHTGTLPPGDIVTRGYLRCTGLRRTVGDLATVLDDDTLELVVESALRQDPRLELTSASSRGRASMHRVLARRPPDAPPTESELETRYLQLIRTADLPPPQRQYQVRDAAGRCLWRLDVCWPEARLWVELDGRGTHAQPAAVLSDRHRQNELAVRLQWAPLRFTWDDVTVRGAETVCLTESAYKRGLGWEGLPGGP